MWLLWVVALFVVLVAGAALVDRRRRRGSGSSVPGTPAWTARDALGDPNIATTMAIESSTGPASGGSPF